MKMLWLQFLLETKLFFRRKDDLFWTLAFPVFFIVLFGLIYQDMMWEDLGIRAIEYIMPGIIVMAVMTTGIMATATGFVEDREKGIFRRLSLTPVKRYVILGAQLVHRYLIILVQTAILLMVAVLAFNVQIHGNLAWVWIGLTAGALCFLGIGFALTGFIRSARAATPISMTIFFIFMFLGAIFFPVEIMPNFLQTFSGILPSTNLNDTLRMVIIGAAGIGEAWRELLIIGGWFAGSLVLAVRFFRWE